jgi:transforming growth factor-beta-induced protein
MKIFAAIYRTYPLLIFLLPFAFLVACNNDNDEPDPDPEPDPTDSTSAPVDSTETPTDTTALVFLENQDNLSALLDAAEAAELTSELEAEDDELTIFAPTNAAFSAFLEKTGVASLSEVDKDTLAGILQYHLLQGITRAADFETSSYQTLFANDSIDVSVGSDGAITLNDSTSVTDPDNELSNAIVHVINRVLVPDEYLPKGDDNDNEGDENDDGEEPVLDVILDIVARGASFTVLEEALDKFPDLTAALGSTEGTFTVFAPDDDAFTAFLNSSSRYNTLEDISNDTLKLILQYHVIADSALKAADLTDPTPPTLEGSTIAVSGSNGQPVLNDSINIRGGEGLSDVAAANGIIHVIDQLLVPESAIVEEDSTETEPTLNLVQLAADNNLNLLVEAINRLPEIKDTLENASSNLTLFAPGDEAFTTLLNGISAGTGNTYSNLDDVTDFVLKRLLTTHILSGGKTASALQQTEETFEGSFLSVGETNGEVTVGTSSVQAVVTNADKPATNGVLHVIDEVLVPSFISNAYGTVLEPAIFDADERFTVLVTAIENAGLYPTLTTGASSSSRTLGEPGKYTLFAPVDSAFNTRLLVEGGDERELKDLLEAPNLADILKYHVAGEGFSSADFPVGTSVIVVTLADNNKDFVVNNNGTSIIITDDTDDTATIVEADLEESNGVMHVIDNVLDFP